MHQRSRASGPFGADDIVYLADMGCLEADDVLREIIAEKTEQSRA